MVKSDKTSNEGAMQKRRGLVKIPSKTWLEEGSTLLAELGILPMRVEHVFYSDVFEIHFTSEILPEVATWQVVPEYLIEVETTPHSKTYWFYDIANECRIPKPQLRFMVDQVPKAVTADEERSLPISDVMSETKRFLR